MSIVQRFGHIRREFGNYAFFRVLVMLVAMPVMAIWAVVYSGSPIAPIVTVTGLIAGFLLRNRLADAVQFNGRILTAGGIVYAVVLFAGDRLGFERHTKILIILVTTVISFNVNFWSLSDPGVVRKDRD